VVVRYISRVQANDPRRHSILKVETFRTAKFAEQINLNVNNGWGKARSATADWRCEKGEGGADAEGACAV
jgi:hypothetical protein